jgi:hypothetical protein
MDRTRYLITGKNSGWTLEASIVLLEEHGYIVKRHKPRNGCLMSYVSVCAVDKEAFTGCNASYIIHKYPHINDPTSVRAFIKQIQLEKESRMKKRKVKRRKDPRVYAARVGKLGPLEDTQYQLIINRAVARGLDNRHYFNFQTMRNNPEGMIVLDFIGDRLLLYKSVEEARKSLCKEYSSSVIEVCTAGLLERLNLMVSTDASLEGRTLQSLSCDETDAELDSQQDYIVDLMELSVLGISLEAVRDAARVRDVTMRTMKKEYTSQIRKIAYMPSDDCFVEYGPPHDLEYILDDFELCETQVNYSAKHLASALGLISNDNNNNNESDEEDFFNQPKKGTDMKNQANKQLEKNKQAAQTAAKMETGHLVLNQIQKVLEAKAPVMLKGYVKEYPAVTKVIAANLMVFAADNYLPCNRKAALVAEAALEASMQEVIRSINIEDILDDIVAKLPKGLLDKINIDDSE